MPISTLIANKTYLFFSHTIKKQDYNRELLQAMLDKKIKIVDYEVIKNKNGKRLLGFGRYAGIVGAYNGLLAYGTKTEKYTLRSAHLCQNREEMGTNLNNSVLLRHCVL